MAEGARSFYGGQAPTGTQGGELTAGHYDGPEAHVEAPWKCPACGVQNEGRLALGCVHCGRGKPGVHVGVQQPPTPPPPATGAASMDAKIFLTTIDRGFAIWLVGQPPLDTSHMEIARRAFEAGWKTGAQHQAHTMKDFAVIATAAPATAAVEQLAPEGKPRRTIVAALQLFRDQVLTQAEAEIASGEWCSVEEVDQLIAQLQTEEDV